MFKNTFQSGLLSIFYSCGADPLALWDMEINNGHVRRLSDAEVNSLVLEIISTNVTTTYITCPRNKQYLGIKLPFMVMIVKNMKRYFSFEIMILDDKNLRRRFRISNFQSTTKVKPFCTTMPIGLSDGWNQIQFNLCDFTRRAYGTQYLETLRVQINANIRIRRIYFAERLFTEEELPQDYKLYMPMERKQKEKEKRDAILAAKKSVASKLALKGKKGAAAVTPRSEPENEEAPPEGEEAADVAESETPLATPAETGTGAAGTIEPSEAAVSEAAESEAMTERAETPEPLKEGDDHEPEGETPAGTPVEG